MTARILVAHGSPDPRSAATARRVADRIGAVAAFLDLDRPTPADAIARAVADGHRAVDVVPLLLCDAFHRRVDVPRVVAAARAANPGVRLRVGSVVGGTHLVPALARGLPPADAVVLAAAGTGDPAARLAIDLVAADLGATLGVPCATAYAAGEPGVGETVRRLAAHGRVVVASYFIAPGVLHDRVRTAALEAGVVGVGEPFADAPELLAALLSDVRATPAPKALLLRA